MRAKKPTNPDTLSRVQRQTSREAYNVNKTPAIYLLNKEGRIMSKNLRGKELEKKVVGLLN